MSAAPILAEVWRGPFLESVHRGHAVISDAKGGIVAAWGDPAKVILPRSSSKMLQAIPLIETGAAKAFGLKTQHLAVSCASHQGATIHTDLVGDWIADLGYQDSDFCCGPQPSSDKQVREAMIRAGQSPCRIHNNCSGKHAGFLSVRKHLGAGADYVDPDHPVQRNALAVFEDMTGETSPGFGIDGCSAPNFACSLSGLALAMARMADPSELGPVRENAARSLIAAMAEFPELVAGKGRACTELMQAMGNGTVIKTGAEAVFVGILPDRGLGIALKIEDGATRASEAAIAALLVRLGVADSADPTVQKRLNAPMHNFAGLLTGSVRPSDDLYKGGTAL